MQKDHTQQLRVAGVVKRLLARELSTHHIIPFNKANVHDLRLHMSRAKKNNRHKRKGAKIHNALKSMIQLRPHRKRFSKKRRRCHSQRRNCFIRPPSPRRPIFPPKRPPECCPPPCGKGEPIVVPGSQTVFGEQRFLNLSFDQALTLPYQDTSVTSTLSYAIINRGSSPLVIQLEISPNAQDFVVDSSESIPSGAMRVITPNRFLRFTRLTLAPIEEGDAGYADVYYQKQTWGLAPCSQAS
ncbi:DUF6385 domain-containing protein [Paenibacillus sp. 481]|uniref:DUF6385 domain-containing protein n=1 Tax=Paenibacillus sp. 481 TaxID=2835869 RepID=UPI001E430EE7|nr:DUF6385 domain-containing protein [Paenibacillus sp. 481]UHA75032.1 hypothetical protein KIK04_08410 [Paenibacillus sp. 481]